MGGSSLTPSMRDFDSFIKECELLDPPLRNASFTWSNMQESPVCKRLDRFLYSNEWGLLFPQGLQEALIRRTSNHWPIVMDTNPFMWGPTPFRFENMWLQHTNFKENFRDWWSGFQGNGWKEGGLNPDLLSQRASRKGDLEELILREEIHWRQKAKVKWVKEGDCNSKFYHKVANGRRNRKYIKELENERGLVLKNAESITEEILHYFEKLYTNPIGESGIINQSTNASFIILIPKKSLSKRILDFRPISLITSLYKIIAKVLSGRLRGVLHETIHYTQDAFVQGRQILDAVLIANEIVDERRRSGEEGVVFKIDFEKAYDHVKWDFLDHVLEKKGFSPRWRKWMSGCLSSVSYAILVNVADVLSRMLMRAEERNMMEGFRVGRFRTRVSHLQFADDTIFFSNSREEELQTLKSLLLVFGHISGLKVNLNKSSIYGINLDQAHLSRLAEMLDCKASGWPILYLGLPLGGNPKACGFWDLVVERISRVGEGKRDHLVRWDVVCKPKTIGGLGLGNISWRNLALLGNGYGGILERDQLFDISKMVTSLSLEGYCSSLSGVFFDYSVCGRKWGKNSVLGRFVVGGSNLWEPNSEIEDLEGFMRSLDDLYLSPSNFPSKFVWNSQVPFKVKSFVWESADHLFLHCSLTIGLWHRLFQLAKMDWVPPRSIYDMMSIKFKGFGNSKRGIVLWQAASIALIRVVWWERTQGFLRIKQGIQGSFGTLLFSLLPFELSVPRHLRGFPLM
ncbi:Transposon TX1 uncharacterized 149 kDa protein [Vitis vinifera]|uniref:Transposon TX1 uncharacterized 149 kDa protein n=1 Tax=Vitis vinifera TaxID=29760 RepID=A0A438JRE5_VITVI|nr:Transposon TX1 uncharacterized 149 kDa protein [Vitis vinifera]